MEKEGVFRYFTLDGIPHIIMNNIKISAKLAIGFGLLLIVMFIVALYATVNLIRINNEYSHVLTYPSERIYILQRIPTEVANMRRHITTIAWRTGEPDAIAGPQQELQEVRALLTTHINTFVSNVNADPQFTAEERNRRLQNIASLEALINQYFDDIIAPILPLAHQGDHETVLQFAAAGGPVVAAMTEIYTAMIDEAQQIMDATYHDMDVLASSTITTLIVLSVLGLISGALIATYIARSVSKPINEVVAAIEEVVDGNFNVNIREGGKDEVGILSRSAKRLVNNLKTLIHDLEHMAEEQEKGDLDVFVDPDKYHGEYKIVVEEVNTMVEHHLDMMRAALSGVKEIARGNFDVQLERYPLKKAFINEAFDILHENITDVAKGVDGMIKAAAVDGDMAYHIDESLFTGYGKWLDMVKGLNAVCEAVDKPIVETKEVLSRINQGYFDYTVNGNYAGDFKSMKEDINNLVAKLGDYVHEIDACLADVSRGNLTHKTTMNFEGEFARIGESINNIASTLHKTMSEINAASSQVLSGARQISTSAMDLANGATEQASSVQQLNASIDMISQQTKQNSESADEANTLSNKSTENAQEGNEAMKQMLEAMLQIKESSNNISRIIKVIQDIAFQTNLLSLNAAVEAARAGEHGKGFSVVAEEVRNLAARSQTAATETTGLIEDSINRVETGSGIAESTAESLDIIVSNASEVLEIINGISISSKEQSESISQVSIGLAQISQVVQSNSAVSEETAAAAQELNSQAEILQQLVGYFKL